MDKTYQPDRIEQRWYDHWEAQGFFKPTPARSDDNQPFCVMLPPPNVTGTLHMGHAFQHTLMDLLTRYHKMRGDSSLWQPGMDHAGIATQMLVERQINAQGQTRHDLGRDTFLERVWDWKEQSGGTITRQMRRLGTACDWSRERFTMDEGLSDAVREVFVKLYEDGLIYRGKRLVNWDPVLHTALSDLEVLSAEEKGHMWHFRYPLADDNGQATEEYLVVATTRPETLLGDTAVAVHPEDTRYQSLIGKQVLLPLANRLIPVVADAYADPEKGTGCVKITPAHDFNDYQVGKRHELPLINVLTTSAALNDNDAVPDKYRGMDRYDARQQIVADMEDLGLLEVVKDHVLMVPRGDRSGAVVEPYLTDQWYVDLTTEQQADGRPGGKTRLTNPAIEAVSSGNIRFVPGNWDKTYYQWMNNLEDWCISRQLWWGHRIPAWYDEEQRIYVGHSEQQVREKYQLDDSVLLRQDEDVLDTWFSSALWPFSTLGWPESNDDLKTFYPTSVLVTGFDIIFFWVARMILFGHYCMKDIPFHDVYVHGLVRDADGMKMSKSKGNTLDPLDIIDGISLEKLLEKRTSGLMQPHLADKISKATRRQFPEGIPSYGTDALRFTFAALASNGRDVRLDLNRIEGYRNFCNKLWNAARFVIMQCAEQDTGLDDQKARHLSWADQWILQALHHTIGQVSEHIDQYRFDLAAQTLYEFIWHEYCDWYLEFSKPTLTAADTHEAEKRGTRHTLVHVLETTLRLIHPFMPYISEEIWQSIKPLTGKQTEAIMLEAYPVVQPPDCPAEVQPAIEWLKTFIMNIRRIRAEMNIAPGRSLAILLRGWSDTDQMRYQQTQAWIKSLAKVDRIEWLAADVEAPESATALVGDMQILIPLAGLIDKQAEINRLEKSLEKMAKGLLALDNRLNNPAFTEKAKPEVVDQARQQQQEQRTALEQLELQLTKIKAL